jgi:large subunit ribosomal protein L24
MAMAMQVRKNDTVLVIRGKDAGKRGKVLKVFPSKGRVIVEKVNVMKKHTRPNPGRGVQGGIAEREAPVHASNLMLVCPECDKPTRVKNERLEDGTKVRVCRHCRGTVA